MNDDAHKFTSDASETNSLENAKKLKENRLQELETSSKISIQFNYENQTKKKKGEQRIFSFIGVGF